MACKKRRNIVMLQCFTPIKMSMEIRPEIVVVQPGVSVGGVTNNQSKILAAAATYLKETVGIRVTIACSK